MKRSDLLRNLVKQYAEMPIPPIVAPGDPHPSRLMNWFCSGAKWHKIPIDYDCGSLFEIFEEMNSEQRQYYSLYAIRLSLHAPEFEKICIWILSMIVDQLELEPYEPVYFNAWIEFSNFFISEHTFIKYSNLRICRLGSRGEVQDAYRIKALISAATRRSG